MINQRQEIIKKIIKLVGKTIVFPHNIIKILVWFDPLSMTNRVDDGFTSRIELTDHI